jgi:hypothetical protein
MHASTTQNTTTQYTTINMSRSRPTLQRLALSLSMGRAVAPPNHGASAPRHHTQAASRRACACCRWSDRLGGRNERHQKIERGGSALALGGHRFKCLNNNQMGDGDEVRGCVGEEARMLGWNVWGGRLPVVWGVKLIDKKNRWMGGPLALDGCRLMGGHNNQPKDVVDGEGGVGEETRPGGTCGGRCPIVWGVEWSGKKKKKNTSWP